MEVNPLVYGIPPSNTIHQSTWRAIFWCMEYQFHPPTQSISLYIWRAIFWFIEYSLYVPPSNTIHQSIWRAISWFMAYLLFVPPPTQYSSLYGGQYPAEWNNYQYNSLSHSPAHCKFWLQGKVRSSVESCYSSTLVGQSKINQNYLTCSHCLCSVVSNSYGKCHIFNVATISKCMHSNTCNQNCCFII